MPTCNEDSCSRSFKAHRWGTTKAHGEGWFIQKSGEVWCPEHVPEWVERWRKKKTGSK